MGILSGTNSFAEEAGQAAPAVAGHQEEFPGTGRHGLL